MIQVEVLVVRGEILNRGGIRVQTLPEKIKKEVNEVVKKIDGEVRNIQTETDFGSLASGGSALILITYEAALKGKK